MMIDLVILGGHKKDRPSRANGARALRIEHLPRVNIYIQSTRDGSTGLAHAGAVLAGWSTAQRVRAARIPRDRRQWQWRARGRARGGGERGGTRVLVCHDMAGGYHEDSLQQGWVCPAGEEMSQHATYRHYTWELTDLFIYFSHDMVTVPPPGYVAAGHPPRSASVGHAHHGMGGRQKGMCGALRLCRARLAHGQVPRGSMRCPRVRRLPHQH